jgi:SAM-dependent methyltransferase
MSDGPDLQHDQMPEPWSQGAGGYGDRFAVHTAAYADPFLDALDVTAEVELLDVAAGTGALSLAAARRGASVLATDFAPGMVAELTRRADAAGLRIRTRVMDGQSLELADDSVDAAGSMFGLMFFPDPLLGMVELARVVRPGGRVGTATWNLERFSLRTLLAETLRRSIGVDTPSAAPTWSALGAEDGLEQLLRTSGLADVRVIAVQRRWVIEDPAGFVRGLPDWSPPSQPLFEALDASTIERTASVYAEVVAEHADEDGGFEVEALVGTGRVGG